MAVALARPQGDDGDPERPPAYASDWYQETDPGEPVDIYLPIFQGDVFVGVHLDVAFTDVPAAEHDPGDVLPDAVMLVGHPCSMVAGSKVLPYQEVVRVRPTAPIRYQDYGETRFEEFFLPFLDRTHPEVHYSACLHERALVATEDLDLDHRVTALSLEGVVALQQRITHESTRVIAPESMLREATEPRFNENQHARDWNEGVLAKLPLDRPELLARFDVEAVHFDNALTAPIKAKDDASDYTLVSSLRQQMFDHRNAGSINQAMKTLIKRRKSVVAGEWQQAQQRAANAAKQAAEAAADQVVGDDPVDSPVT